MRVSVPKAEPIGEDINEANAHSDRYLHMTTSRPGRGVIRHLVGVYFID